MPLDKILRLGTIYYCICQNINEKRDWGKARLLDNWRTFFARFSTRSKICAFGTQAQMAAVFNNLICEKGFWMEGVDSPDRDMYMIAIAFIEGTCLSSLLSQEWRVWREAHLIWQKERRSKASDFFFQNHLPPRIGGHLALDLRAAASRQLRCVQRCLRQPHPGAAHCPGRLHHSVHRHRDQRSSLLLRVRLDSHESHALFQGDASSQVFRVLRRPLWPARLAVRQGIHGFVRHAPTVRVSRSGHLLGQLRAAEIARRMSLGKDRKRCLSLRICTAKVSRVGHDGLWCEGWNWWRAW